MTNARQKIFEKISIERDRQYNLPGSEYDQLHSINDWIAIAAQYLTRSVDRKHIKTDQHDKIESLIKAAAVIVAALEHIDKNQ
jgi:hypothetical protein